MFGNLPAPDKSKDGIMAMMKAVAADPRPGKVDLTVGLYKNELGQTPMMEAVRRADQELAASRPNKAYVLPAGTPSFMRGMRELAFGSECSDMEIDGVQTPGASGALSLILKMIKTANPDAKVWVSDPTYLNHLPTIRAMNLEPGIYPFLDRQSMTFREEEFHRWLSKMGPNDCIIFHGSCHNPSGLKVDSSTWKTIAQAAGEQGFFPIFDTAYQGLEDGVDEDAAGLKLVAQNAERLALSISCSKSFSLYSDRVGCAFVMGRSSSEVGIAKDHLSDLSRATYWVPPNNGAEIVAKVLTTPELKRLWLQELSEIRHRISSLRYDLVRALRVHTGGNGFDYVAENCGMFSMLPVLGNEMKRLYQEFAIYGLADGRINIAALPENRIDYVARSFATVFEMKREGLAHETAQNHS